jgi:hypothetical protein
MTPRPIVLLVCAAIAAAQDPANKITLPLSDPTQPATVKVRLLSGNITVTVGAGPEIVVESDPPPAPKPVPHSDAPPGMHRIDDASRGFTAQEDHNVVLIGAQRGIQRTNLRIQVPANTSLDVETTNGSIDLKGISGAGSAHTANGSVTASLDKPLPDKPMSFSTLNGKIDVTLPADTKARLRLKATKGAIYSDFDVKIEPDGTRSINGGGPEYLFEATNGTILVHKNSK